MTKSPSFETLSPDVIVASIENHLGIYLDGMITPYNSYVNRVYGIQDEDGKRYIVKYYRPGRWSKECILEEHTFIRNCEDNEIPVIPPLELGNGTTLGEAGGIYFSVFPFRSGRTFDISGEDDWNRLGTIVGRMHRAGRNETAFRRPVCSPLETTAPQIEKLTSGGLIPDGCLEDFIHVCEATREIIDPLFEGVETIRIHGDCHRGNILDRIEEGLLLIDFDDMMTGPPVQDLWLLLPGHLFECPAEMELLLQGYARFSDFDRETLTLVEPLRFMRLIHFLTWCATQKDDHSFQHHFPDWGTEAFWIKEIEDLRYQQRMIREQLSF